MTLPGTVASVGDATVPALVVPSPQSIVAVCVSNGADASVNVTASATGSAIGAMPVGTVSPVITGAAATGTIVKSADPDVVRPAWSLAEKVNV